MAGVQAVPLSFGHSLRGLRTGAFRLLETRHSLGMTLARHEHERACVNFVLEGCYAEEYAHSAGEFLPLAACYKPAGEPHANRFAHAPARCLLVEVQDEELVDPDLDFRRLASTRHPRAASLALRIWHELAGPDELSALSIDEWGLALYSCVLGEGGASDAGSARVRAVADALHDDPREPWTLSGLASHVGLHPSHLARAFRARHRCTIGEYLRGLRLDEAARRLALGDEPISALAAEFGFADQSHCTRAFRRRFGTTPARYRRAFRG